MLFVVGFAAGFDGWIGTTIVGCLVVGSLVLAPAIVFGYAVKAAEREDREPRFVTARGLGWHARPAQPIQGEAMITAAVLKGVGEDVHVHDDIEIAPPGAGECKVKIVASGVCHSDLSVQNGTIPLPPPIVLGHEGAGIVEEVGDGVSSLAARRPRGAVVRAALRRLLLLRPRPGLPLREERHGGDWAACSTAPPASPSTASRCARWRCAARSATTPSSPRSRW